MKRLILRTYDFLSCHKALAATVLILLVAVSAWMTSRLHYEEDIAAFLPQDDQTARYADIYARMGGDDKIAVLFTGEDAGERNQAMSAFLRAWAAADSLGTAPPVQMDGDRLAAVFEGIQASYPYFARPEDYERADSLLQDATYLGEQLASVRQQLWSPFSSLSVSRLRTDPLALFSPVLTRLEAFHPAGNARMEEGFLVTEDGIGIVFLRSVFGSTESARNAALSRELGAVTECVSARYPDVRIHTTGGPLVAAENAARIKRDSALSLSIALLLICLVLWFSFKRLDDVFWIALSILCGAVFSLGLISLFKSSVSIIILGIGSIILGIAVNYPLHYVDHLKYRPDKREALRDQINPLLVGNITTVGAFLSLLWLKAGALRDFGFIGAMMLVGTILFVLVFLPVFVPAARSPRRTLRLDLDRFLSPSAGLRKWGFAAFLALTVLFAVWGRQQQFDADMHHINYMTASQRYGFEVLASLGGEDDGRTLYLVSEAEDTEKALEAAWEAERNLPDVSYRSITDFLPCRKMQQERLAAWASFRDRHPDLPEKLRAAAAEQGFSATAFRPFDQLWAAPCPIRPLSDFSGLQQTLGASMVLQDSCRISVVTFLQAADPEQAASVIRDRLAGTAGFCFHQQDISGRLVRMLSEDFDRIGILCSLIVFLFLALSFGRIELSLLAFLPLALAWIWILGLMHLFGWQFNIVNIILATFIFGQGDDYTIFITEGLIYEYGSGKKILPSYKNCVVLSALIMFIGIGALIFARHPAMHSLATVTMVGMFSVVLMACYLPPLIFRFLTKGPFPVTFKRLAATAVMGLMYIPGMALLLLCTWVYFLFPATEVRKFRYHRILQKIARYALAVLPGVKVCSERPSETAFDKPALIVANHQSSLDILLLLSMTPRMVMLTHARYRAHPLLGYLLRKAEFCPLSDDLEDSVPQLQKLVERGYSIVVFPEGTRSADGRIQRFHRGAFVLARTLGLDILPVYMHGPAYAWNKAGLILSEAEIYVEMGQRVPATAIAEDVQAFTRQFRAAFVSHFEAIRRVRETAAFLLPYVKYQYVYKGREAEKACRKALTPAACREIDALQAEKVRIVGSGYGAFALLLALARPEIPVVAYERDEMRYLVASRCAIVPANLHYVHGMPEAGPEPGEKEIVL